MLHVTNGDHALAMLRHAGMQGDILPWRDVLHEGPVRASLSPDELSQERAAFIAEAGWGERAQVLADFRTRNARLAGARGEDEVVLWFEHDLYDQLQLIQVLDVLAANPPRRLTLVCEAEYLGTMAPARAASLYIVRKEVETKQLSAAQRAWSAFRSQDPRAIPTAVPELRFLGAALRRLLEEYPWTTDALSRLERTILRSLEGGARCFADIFRAAREEPNFLGDVVLLWHLQRLQGEGALEYRQPVWQLKGAPQRRCQRWLGGVRVMPEGSWRFDPALGRIVQH